MDTIEMNVAADDRTAIAIREALRDRQAQPQQGSRSAAIPPADWSAAVLRAGAL